MHIQHLIDGKPVDSPGRFETLNPATQEVLAEVAQGGAAEVDAAVAAALSVVRFAEAHADRLVELDVNPLIVRPAGMGAVAADVLIRLAADGANA